MSYTPRTEEVRGDYAHFQCPVGVPDCTDPYVAALAEFDRWLAALIREAKAEALEEKGYFLKGHAEWTRSNFLPGPNSDACAKYNDEIGDELIEDAAELRARAAEYREGSET